MTHDWSKAVARRAAEIEKSGEKKKEPPPWRPNRDDYEEVETSVSAQHIRSQPLNYASLADMEPGVIKMIEANAAADLRKVFDQQGISPMEQTLKPHWQLVVEGYGFRAPEGYIHPEAPPEEVEKAVANWKRAVDMAGDSLAKVLFLKYWRKRHRELPPEKKEEMLRRITPSGEVKRISPYDATLTPDPLPGQEFEIKAVSDDEDSGPPWDVRVVVRKFGSLPLTSRRQMLRDLGVPEEMVEEPYYNAMHWLRVNHKAERFAIRVMAPEGADKP